MILDEIVNQTIFKQSLISTQIFSPKGDSIAANKAWEKLWGIRHEEIKGYNVLKDNQLIKTGVMPYIKRGFRGETVNIPVIKYEPKKTLKAKNVVDYRWVDSTIYPIKNKRGKILNVVLQQIDSTDKKDIEERLDIALENSTLMFFYQGLDMKYNWCKNLPFPLNEKMFLGKTDHEVFDQETAESFYEMKKKVIKTGKDMQVEVDVILAGRQFIAEVTMKPDLDNEGKVIGIRGVVGDITDKKLPFLELQNIKYALDQSAIIAITDSHGTIQYVNDKFTHISKYSRRELIGKTHKIVNSKYHKKQFIKNMWDTITSGKVWKGEIHNRAKNGNYYWLDTTITPLLDKHGKPQQFIAVHHDITKRKELETQKDEFIGIASHELKTPVTSLKGYAQVMHNKFEKIGLSEQVKQIDKMEAQIDRLTLLIQDLLDVTKIETGKLQFHEEQFYIDNLVNEIVDEMQLTTEKHKIIIKSNLHKKIYADHERIGQVMTNFISNAIKYSPDAKRIIVKVDKVDDSIKVSVKDFGVGISAKNQTRLFERFYRVSGSKEDTFPGLGLGLYISSEIVKRHKGKIWVESEKGKGSTFCFAIPIDRKKVVNGNLI